MSELEASLADGGVVNDGKKACWVGHERAVKECFVVVEEIDQVDVAFEVRGLLRELRIHALQLEVLGLGYVRHETNETQCLLFGLGKGGRFVESRILQHLYSSFSMRCSHASLPPCLRLNSLLGKSLSSCSGNVGLHHLCRVDNTVEFCFGHKSQLQGGVLQVQIMVHRVVRD